MTSNVRKRINAAPKKKKKNPYKCITTFYGCHPKVICRFSSEDTITFQNALTYAKYIHSLRCRKGNFQKIVQSTVGKTYNSIELAN